MVEFADALAARKIVDGLMRQLKTSRYNPDLHLMHHNLEKMVSELSILEVSARQNHSYVKVDEYKEKLAKSIDYLEKMILMLKLTD